MSEQEIAADILAEPAEATATSFSENRTSARPRVRTPKAERAAVSGMCEQCREPFRDRQDRRFCRDACRTRFGRERKAREVQETIARLARLAGVNA